MLTSTPSAGDAEGKEVISPFGGAPSLEHGSSEMAWRKSWPWVEGSSSAMKTSHVSMRGRSKCEDRREPG